MAELVAIRAAVAANCEPCFKHFDLARKLGVSQNDMAVDMAQKVKQAQARAMTKVTDRFLPAGEGAASEADASPRSCC